MKIEGTTSLVETDKALCYANFFFINWTSILAIMHLEIHFKVYLYGLGGKGKDQIHTKEWKPKSFRDNCWLQTQSSL